PKAGLAYAARRNEDLPGHPHVSGLSPWIRHRLVTEAEVIDAATARHGGAAAKFVAEVWWRTYWKGWLEMRPAIWTDYANGLTAALNRVQTEAGLRAAWEAACKGETGIDGFDHWARELVATNWMHNHARMWFASIWIFTLRLPWELGADFFLRHLLDGDPASNTLSWRWVGGLHTAGKTYLATPDNIAKNTGGRFRPTGLARVGEPLGNPRPPAPRPAPQGQDWARGVPALLLLHEDDLDGTWLLAQGLAPVGAAALTATAGRSPLAVAQGVRDFVAGAVADALDRHGGGPVFDRDALARLADHAATLGAGQVVAPHAPVGPTASALRKLAPLLAERGIALVQPLRDHDRLAWPHATHGFFRFREAVM
ncbi:MAG: hypothetical protein RIR62_142, partial [Pseudomonadota bacterium]